MNHISLCKYTILKETIPYAYGVSPHEVLFTRACYLFGRCKPPSIEKRNVDWIDTNEKDIIKAIKKGKTKTVKVNLPFCRMSLYEVIKQNYITVRKSSEDLIPRISTQTVCFIHWNCLYLSLQRELLLTTTVGFTKQVFKWINMDNIPYECAFIIGFVKGFTKLVSDMTIYKKNNKNLIFMVLKYSVDIFAEIITVYFFDSNKDFNPFFKSAIKGFFKYLLKHLIQRIVIQITATELGLEMFKAGFKGWLRNSGYSIFGAFIGPMFGSLIGATLVNIFIDQCAFAPSLS